MIKVATHSGGFHADDVFAIAAFQLLLGLDNISVIRTRDEAVIASADYVVDVGGVYDHEQKRYDHHQNGAPVRENGIPYAGFGLMWRHYGAEICGSDEAAAAIDEKLCWPIDAGDNGISLYTLNDSKVHPFELYNLVGLFSPVWGSGEDDDEQFFKSVAWAKSVIERVIEKTQGKFAMQSLVKEVYDAADDKSILIFQEPVSAAALIDFPDVQVVVSPSGKDEGENWTAVCVRKDNASFATKVSFPESWAGLRDKDLIVASGIPDAIFCHKARFFFVADSKDSAIKAARLAT